MAVWTVARRAFRRSPAEPPARRPPRKKEDRRAAVAQKDRFRGVRIFDISDIKNPRQVAAVQTCRGSHTHTLVLDPNDKDNVYIYVSGTSFVRPAGRAGGMLGRSSGQRPEHRALPHRGDQGSARRSARSEDRVQPARVHRYADRPINGLNNGGTHDKGKEKPEDTNQCHDITVYSAHWPRSRRLLRQRHSA